MKKLLAAITMIAAFQVTAAPLIAGATDADAQRVRSAAEKKDDDRYRKGTQALDSERWNEAAELFSELAKMGGARGDRALYWLAYAQQKGGRVAEALATLQQLHQKYPSSRWNDDAKALELEARQSSGQQVAPETLGDDDLKLLAITSLLHSDQERAVTLLEKILQSKASEDIKERALFVLGQSGAPRARSLIENIARGKSGAELQEDALHFLGTTGDPRNRALLNDVFRTSMNPETRQAALQGMMISGDRQAVASAGADKNPEVRSEAAKLLGAMGATADLDRLYATESSNEVKEEILQGMFIAGNIDRLIQIARTEKTPELRHVAIRSVGIIGTPRSTQFLLELWQAEAGADTKEAVVEGLFIQGNVHTLIELAKKEKDRAVKRDIVQKLSLMQDKEARAYMQQLLGQ